MTTEPAQQHLQNVETIASLQAHSERLVNSHQRGIERMTAFIGRPTTVYILVTIVLFWTGYNAVATQAGWRAFDPPPFSWLQGIVGILALMMTTFVLTTQNRLARIAEQRSHLDLQVNLLSEQKAAKIIELLEELRRDMPDVRNRVDEVADVMQESVDPGAVLSALEGVERPSERDRFR
jgi:uncharacterized membrane protein